MFVYAVIKKTFHTSKTFSSRINNFKNEKFNVIILIFALAIIKVNLCNKCDQFKMFKND